MGAVILLPFILLSLCAPASCSTPLEGEGANLALRDLLLALPRLLLPHDRVCVGYCLSNCFSFILTQAWEASRLSRR